MNPELVDRLPQEVKDYIYHVFLAPEIHYNEFKRRLQSQDSRRLDITDIRPHLPTLLVFYPWITRCEDRFDDVIREVYVQHKIKDNKFFLRCTKGDSFALQILCFLYH